VATVLAPHIDRRPEAVREPLTTEVLTQFAQLEQLHKDWDRLWRCDPDAEVFQHFAWIRAFWRAYGPSLHLATIVVRERGRIIGILPLAVADGTLQFLGSRESDYNDILCEDERQPEIIGHALQQMLRLPVPWLRSDLANVPKNSKLLRHWREQAPQLRDRIRPVRSNWCPTILLQGQPHLRKSVRSHVLRQTRKLERIGTLQFRHIENEPKANAHLRALFRQHRERLAMRIEESQFSHPRVRHYYRAMLDEPELRPYLRFGLLELNGAPLAYHFGFTANGKYIWYKPTFNTEFWDFSPGEVLLNAVVEQATTDGLREVDLTVGDEHYKSRFCSEVRQNYQLAFGPSAIQTYVQTAALLVKNGAKQHPSVRDFGRSVKRRARQTITGFDLRLRRIGALALFTSVAADLRRRICRREELVIGTLQCHSSPDSRIRVKRTTVGGLALAAACYSDIVAAPQLQALRVSGKTGAIYAAWQRGTLAGFVLLSNVAKHRAGCDPELPPWIPLPALLATHLWIAPAADRRDTVTALLGHVAANSGAFNRQALVVTPRCHVKGCDLVQPIARLIRFRLFGRSLGPRRWLRL